MRSECYSPWEMTRKWQRRWKREGVFVARLDPDRPKFYCYEFPPFPSGSLHMGHVRNYVMGDATARYMRRMGFNVLYAQGFDSLGLPVEETALKAGQTPQRWVEKCVAHMAEELLGLGLSYDHTRFVSYHDPEYYRWTQWIFLRLYEAGMIYRAETWVGWCEECQTAVATELIEDGRCWRCDGATGEKRLWQWFLDVKRIAPELLAGLERAEYQESAAAIQRNWIGRKDGFYVTVPVEGTSLELEIFTTTVELLYGMTFLAIAPETPALTELIKGTPDEAELGRAIHKMCLVPNVGRLRMAQNEGAFTGRYGLHPLTRQRVPIFVAPFAVGDFGTGVVFGCPAHGKNDHQFAKAMDLPIINVVDPRDCDLPSPDDEPYLGEGTLTNSGQYNGLTTEEAARAIAADLVQNGLARKGVAFSVKNWCISRQRYWSVPIPIVFCERCGIVPVRESDLPVELPIDGVDLRAPGNPLERHEDFVGCKCPTCSGDARRETSTLDTFVNSSWAYLRYCSTECEDAIFDPEAVNYWMPCDIGFGGKEQVTVGSFYFRVILAMLNALGISPSSEPWSKFIFHGLVMKDGRKMSKSVGNVVNPSEMIERYGVDAVRFHTLSMARPENDINWSEEGLKSSYRFLAKLWDTLIEIRASIAGMEQPMEGDRTAQLTRKQRVFVHHSRVAREKVAQCYRRYQFHNVCSNVETLAERVERFWHHARKNMTPASKALLQTGVKQLLVMMNPVVPHMTEELWERFGNREMICQATEVRSSIGQAMRE